MFRQTCTAVSTATLIHSLLDVGIPDESLDGSFPASECLSQMYVENYYTLCFVLVVTVSVKILKFIAETA
jgi:hypothetical protein